MRRKITMVINEYQTKVETALDQLAEYRTDNAVVPEAGTEVEGAGRPKEWAPNKLLALPVLTKDDTPEKMRNWLLDFSTFLHSGEGLSVASQQAYFRRLIDDHLRRAMEPHMLPQTPVVGKGGCLEMLEKEFKVLYPIFPCQVELFKANQGGGAKTR